MTKVSETQRAEDTALILVRDDPFSLHSGGRSHYLVDAERIWQNLRLREAVLNLWELELVRYETPLTFVGVPRGGDVWAKAITHQVGGSWWGGDPPDKALNEGTTIIVDDVVTTGRSLVETYFRLGQKPKLALVVVDRRSGTPSYMFAVQAWATIALPLTPAGREALQCGVQMQSRFSGTTSG